MSKEAAKRSESPIEGAVEHRESVQHEPAPEMDAAEAQDVAVVEETKQPEKKERIRAPKRESELNAGQTLALLLQAIPNVFIGLVGGGILGWALPAQLAYFFKATLFLAIPLPISIPLLAVAGAVTMYLWTRQDYHGRLY
jgi:hypothetical protein